MRLRSVRYFVYQGVRNVFANGLMSVASITVVMASIAIFGIFIALSQNVTELGAQIKESCEIQIIIEAGTERADVRRVAVEIEALDGVKTVDLFSKEDALLDMKDRFKDEPHILDGLEGENPLRDSYRVTLTDLSKAEAVAAAAVRLENVAKVKNNQEVFDSIAGITGFLSAASLWLVAILGAVAVFIISNTIRLGVFARRKEINIMKFVGATNWFVRWPFIVEGTVIGIAGGIIASAIVTAGYWNAFPGFEAYMEPFRLVAPISVASSAALYCCALGGVIGIVGSAVSVRKHLHV